MNIQLILTFLRETTPRTNYSKYLDWFAWAMMAANAVMYLVN